MKIAVFISVLLITGCANYEDGESSKEVIKNRKLYAKEIIRATNECIKSATSVTHLTAAGNDQEETVKACTESSQKAYGAYSPYYESYLQEWAQK